MSGAYRIESRTLDGGPTTVVAGGTFTLIGDRPAAGGGRGLGFNGGQLMYASIAVCISNDLYREAASAGIALARVAVAVDGDFPRRGAPSTPITVDVELEGDATEARLAELLDLVDGLAEIPNSIRGTTPIDIRGRRFVSRTADSTRGGPA